VTAPARVELSLLGQKLSVRSAASADYLQSLARFVEDRAAAIQQGGVRDPMSALALAAIEIADELHRLRDEQARDAGDVRARLDALVDLIQSVTPPFD
jgi:cell division protein ZapA (FtsZ GTPase activity inhibitor)